MRAGAQSLYIIIQETSVFIFATSTITHNTLIQSFLYRRIDTFTYTHTHTRILYIHLQFIHTDNVANLNKHVSFGVNPYRN